MKELRVLNIYEATNVGENYEDFEGYGAVRYIDNLTTKKIFETLDTLNRERGGVPVDFEELYANYVKKHNAELYEEYLEEFDAEWTYEDFETWLIDCGNAESKDILDALDKFTDYVGGTVGYSPWSYCIAHESVSFDYVYDLYHGSGFYDVVVLDRDDNIDFSFNIYLENRKMSEVIEDLKGHFDIDNYDIKYALDVNTCIENDIELEKAKKETVITWM